MKDGLFNAPELDPYWANCDLRDTQSGTLTASATEPFCVAFPVGKLLHEMVENADQGGTTCVSDDDRDGSVLKLGDAIYRMAEDQLVDASGAPIYLRAKSAQVLRHLAQSPGALVSRDDLINSVWNGLAVTDDSLTQCIADVRRALDDSKRTILKTVPKRGFVLMAVDVTPASAPSSNDGAVHTSHASTAFGAASSDFPVLVHVADTSGVVQSELINAGIARDPSNFDTGSTAYRFSSVAEAAKVCVPLAQRHGAAMVLTALDQSPQGLFAAARPGEILANVNVRDAAGVHPNVQFEDLGAAGSTVAEHAFRLIPGGGMGAISQHLHYQRILPTVSVLPLQNIENNGDDLLGTVFADRLTASLGTSEEINVTSRLSTSAFRHGTSNLSEIGKLLGAEFVLSGFYLNRDGRLQLNLEFAEVASQRMLWSFRLEVPLEEVLGEFEAGYEIVAKVRRAILINEIRRANTQPLSSLTNYSLMFAAVGMMHRLSPGDFGKSRDILAELTERAPNHPIPLAWTARWHLLRVVQGWSDNPGDDAQSALDCTGRALDLDPENVLALACEGHVLTNIVHRLDEAEDRYNLALENNPNDANARALRGMMLTFQDRGDEGLRDTERALHLAPLDPHRFLYLALAAGAALSVADYDRAEDLAKESLRLNRTHASTLRTLAVAQHKSGLAEDAQETVTELLRVQPKLRVSEWLSAAPSANYQNGQDFAQSLRELGVPE
ncbi:MAG: winged helix-turn-helix domain-containing protein [Pseudomonadota bacterium]